MTARTFDGIDEFRSAVGTKLGSSDWFEITQERVDAFALATGDHQWIHVDPLRASRGPFGGTVAHGYLTLALLPFLAGQTFKVIGPTMQINYGLNKVRFPQAIKVGSRIRLTASLVGFKTAPTGIQSVLSYVIEIEDQQKPALVAEGVSLLVGVS